MIKSVKQDINIANLMKSIQINNRGAIKYIGQSGTSGYACAAKGYLADYVLKNIDVSWHKLVFDNSKNDSTYYVDALSESTSNINYSEYETLIMHCTPDLWSKFSKQYGDIPKHIGYCTWETNKLPKVWVEYINTVEEVWVPSYFNKYSFIESGVTSNISVVPHIWHRQSLFSKKDIKIYDYIGNLIPTDVYTYYSIGELNYRKGIEDLIWVFNKINNKYKNTQLILKLHYREYTENNRKKCIDSIMKLTDKIGTSVYVILDNLTNRQIRALHSFGDCYVSLNKGEGFGLTIFDAYNYDKNIITTGYGGHIDFLGTKHRGLVKYKIDKVSGMAPFSTNYSSDQEWAYPDLEHAYELMKKQLM